jgi:hypothetical protein
VVLDSAMASGPARPWLPLAAAVLLASGVVGCQPDCGEKQTIRYEQGVTDPTRTVYQSTSIVGPWLHFPGRRTYELVHNLRTDPVEVSISLAFEERGENLAPSAGNQSVYKVDSAKHLINVTNDTCGEFFVYVVARAAPDPGMVGADAGTD